MPDGRRAVDRLAPPQGLCRSVELVEKADAAVFDVRYRGESMRAFALRFDGRAVAYLNRCVHVQAEMDWQPGQFLDSGRDFILCSLHGAVYDPTSGQCVGGPCTGGRLTAVEVEERDGEVFWLPTAELLPPFDD